MIEADELEVIVKYLTFLDHSIQTTVDGIFKTIEQLEARVKVLESKTQTFEILVPVIQKPGTIL